MKSAERLYSESQKMLMNVKPKTVPTRPFGEDSLEQIDWERKPSNKASDRWATKATEPNQLYEPCLDPEIEEIESNNEQRNDQTWDQNKREDLQQFGDSERNEKELEDVKSEEESGLMHTVNSSITNSIYMDYRNEVLKNLEMSVSLESGQARRQNLTQHMSGLDDNTLDIERELEEIERNGGYANLRNPNFNNDILNIKNQSDISYNNNKMNRTDSEINNNSKIEKLGDSKTSKISNISENYIQQTLKSTQSCLQARPICQETYEDKIYKSIEIELKKSLKFKPNDIAFINKDIHVLTGSVSRSFDETRYFKREENRALMNEDESKARQFGDRNLDENELSRNSNEREYRRNDSESDRQSDRNEKLIGSKEELSGLDDSSEYSYFSSQEESDQLRSHVAMSENRVSYQDRDKSLSRDSPRQEQKIEEHDSDVNHQYLKKGENDLQGDRQYLKTKGNDLQSNHQNQKIDTSVINQYQIPGDNDKLANPQDLEKSFKEQVYSIDHFTDQKNQQNQNNENYMELESSLIESSKHAFPPAQNPPKTHRASDVLKPENEEMVMLEDSQESTSKGLFQSVVNIFGSISSSLGFREKKQSQLKENEVFHSLKIGEGLATHENPDFLKFEECGKIENDFDNFDDNSKGFPNVYQVQNSANLEEKLNQKFEFKQSLKEIEHTNFQNQTNQKQETNEIRNEKEDVYDFEGEEIPFNEHFSGKEQDSRKREEYENKCFSGDEGPDALGKFGDLD